jgi:hypothetical protein
MTSISEEHPDRAAREMHARAALRFFMMVLF